jgi:CheY-like chemotaxis protein
MDKILLVEDHEAQRFLYHEELVEEGYEVVAAKNGLEALKYLEELRFDVIVLDIRMPVLDGIKVMEKITRRYKKIPVILHTAYAEDRNQPVALLADAFVLKSSDLSPLKKTVKKLVQERSGGKGKKKMAKEKH